MDAQSSFMRRNGMEGFRTGARIMLAVLQEDKPQESKDEDKT